MGFGGQDMAKKVLVLRLESDDGVELLGVRDELAGKLEDIRDSGNVKGLSWEFGVRSGEEPRKPRGRPTNQEKRRHIISLASANETLSMSAIARHVGCSDGLVAKVFKDKQQWDRRENWRKP